MKKRTYIKIILPIILSIIMVVGGLLESLDNKNFILSNYYWLSIIVCSGGIILGFCIDNILKYSGDL